LGGESEGDSGDASGSDLLIEGMRSISGIVLGR
jgi:hypothetical protein